MPDIDMTFAMQRLSSGDAETLNDQEADHGEGQPIAVQWQPSDSGERQLNGASLTVKRQVPLGYEVRPLRLGGPPVVDP